MVRGVWICSMRAVADGAYVMKAICAHLSCDLVTQCCTASDRQHTLLDHLSVNPDLTERSPKFQNLQPDLHDHAGIQDWMSSCIISLRTLI